MPPPAVLARTGFIGLGRMGVPMARHILAAGFPLTVYDVRAGACAPLAESGATVAPTAAAVAAASDFVITCVPGPPDVEAAIIGRDGVLAGARPGTIVIETSTIDVTLSRKLGAACAQKNVRYLDAPISGGVDGARAGTLAVMAGGDATVLDEARELLAAFANRIIHVGPTGSGHFTKLINQTIYLGYIALFCEATKAADAYGIERAALIDVLRNSVAGHPLATHWEDRLVSGDRTPGFAIDRVLKDLRLGAETYADLPYHAPIFEAALAAYEGAAKSGHAGDDVTAVIGP